jgi:hypothetical protein
MALRQGHVRDLRRRRGRPRLRRGTGAQARPVRHEPDGKVTVQGEEVDNPDEFKGEPISGGPTDPEAPELAGERRKREKRERMAEEGQAPPPDDD